MSDISHYSLCEKTAGWAMRKYNGHISLWEYQNWVSGEHPDVLMYGSNGETYLFEIKISRADFLQDAKKIARKKYKPKVGLYSRNVHVEAFLKAEAPELYYIEAPHLGQRRYYVCPKGLIQPEEIPEGWGLYWFSGSRFSKKLDSKKWRNNVHVEKSLLTHAFRKYVSGHTSNILVKEYNS